MKPFDQEYEQGEFFCFFAHQSVKQYFWGQNALNPNHKGETVKDKIKCGDKFLYSFAHIGHKSESSNFG